MADVSTEGKRTKQKKEQIRIEDNPLKPSPTKLKNLHDDRAQFQSSMQIDIKHQTPRKKRPGPSGHSPPDQNQDDKWLQKVYKKMDRESVKVKLEVPITINGTYGLRIEDDTTIRRPYIQEVYKDSASYDNFPADRRTFQYVLYAGGKPVANTKALKKIMEHAKLNFWEQLELSICGRITIESTSPVSSDDDQVEIIEPSTIDQSSTITEKNLKKAAMVKKKLEAQLKNVPQSDGGNKQLQSQLYLDEVKAQSKKKTEQIKENTQGAVSDSKLADTMEEHSLKKKEMRADDASTKTEKQGANNKSTTKSAQPKIMEAFQAIPQQLAEKKKHKKARKKSKSEKNNKKPAKEEVIEKLHDKVSNKYKSIISWPQPKPEKPKLPEVQMEEEDDTNTVSSDQTSHRFSKKMMKKVQPPKSTRYQLILNLKQKDITELENLIKGEKPLEIQDDEGNETYLVLRRHVMWVYNEMIQLNQNIALVTWGNGEFKMIRPKSDEEFPTEPELLAKFFEGILVRRLKGRIYIKLRVYYPGENESSWAASVLARCQTKDGWSFYRCLIQAPSMKNIGWIVNSTNHTDKDHLKRYMESKSDFEWGFRLGPVSSADLRIQYKYRVKALTVNVPSDKAEYAISMMNKNFKAVDEDSPEANTRPTWTRSYIYVESERDLSANPDAIRLKYFSSMIEQHKELVKRLEFKETSSIIGDLDAPLITRNNTVTSLRKLIMSLQVQHGPAKSWQLFHAVDFCPDLSQAWISGSRGTGGQGHIFSFLNLCSNEAMSMVRGLGIYLIAMYGNNLIGPLFTNDYWKSVDNWKWDRSKLDFVTPEEKVLKGNMVNNPYLQAMAKMKQIEDEEAAAHAAEEDIASGDEDSNEDVSECNSTDIKLGKEVAAKGQLGNIDTHHLDVDSSSNDQDTVDDKTFHADELQIQQSKRMLENLKNPQQQSNISPELQNLNIIEQESIASSLTNTTGGLSRTSSKKMSLDNFMDYFDQTMTLEQLDKAMDAKYELDNRKREYEYQKMKQALREKQRKETASDQQPQSSPSSDKDVQDVKNIDNKSHKRLSQSSNSLNKNNSPNDSSSSSSSNYDEAMENIDLDGATMQCQQLSYQGTIGVEEVTQKTDKNKGKETQIRNNNIQDVAKANNKTHNNNEPSEKTKKGKKVEASPHKTGTGE